MNYIQCDKSRPPTSQLIFSQIYWRRAFIKSFLLGTSFFKRNIFVAIGDLKGRLF